MVHCSRYRTAWVAWAAVSSSAIQISGSWLDRSTRTYRSHWFHQGPSCWEESAAHSMGLEAAGRLTPESELELKRSLKLISNSINSNLCNSNSSKTLVQFSRHHWRINRCRSISHWIKILHPCPTLNKSEGITAEKISWLLSKSHTASPDKGNRRHMMRDLTSLLMLSIMVSIQY